LAGAVSGFFSVPAPGIVSLPASAVFPAVEQQAAPESPLLAQHSDLPSFIVEQPSLPQQLPSLPLQAMPAAEHLHPSDVPPVLSVGLTLALTTLLSLAAVVEEVVLLVLAALLLRGAFVVLVLPAGLQPANPNIKNARSTASLVFMNSPVESPEVIKSLK
jgi:hypothetical protein